MRYIGPRGACNSSYVISTRCNRKPFGRYEGTKQMISSFLKSSNVSFGAERTAETENTNAHRTNHYVRFMLSLPVILPILTDSIILSISRSPFRPPHLLRTGANEL